MRSQKVLLLLLLSFFLFACDSTRKESTQKVTGSPPADMADSIANADDSHIIWDSWGVPHIFADSEQEIIFSDGWAQIHDHANTNLKLYSHSRGRAAEYWGEKYLESDKLIHMLGHPEMAASQWKQQDPQRAHVPRRSRGAPVSPQGEADAGVLQSGG